MLTESLCYVTQDRDPRWGGFGHRGCIDRASTGMRNRSPSSHSHVMSPSTTVEGSIGWVAAIVHSPTMGSKAANAGFRAVCSMGPSYPRDEPSYYELA